MSPHAPAPRWPWPLLCLLVVFGVFFGGGGARAGTGWTGSFEAAARTRVMPAYGRVPLSFEPNVGQSDRTVRFVAHGAGSSLFLTTAEATLVLAGRSTSSEPVLHLQFPGAGRPAVSAVDPLAGKVNYFLGDDRSRWHTNVPTFGQVRYSHLWPGVDATFYGNGSELEYDLHVAAGANPRRIALRVAGALRERLDSRGALVLTLPHGGEVRELAPVAYQLVDGRRRAVASWFVLNAGITRIALGGYDHRLPLTIDPALVYSTYLGGNSFEQGSSIAVDSAGDAYIAGTTYSTNFPTQNPEQPSCGDLPPGCTLADAFVTKLNPAGTAMIYSSYLGGNSIDATGSIAVDSAGDAYVTGYTFSTNFPTTSGAAQLDNAGVENVFVTKLNPAGNALVFSTYLGGSGLTPGVNPSYLPYPAPAIAIDSAGNAYVGGTTQSTNFPTKNAYQSACADSGCAFGDAFVTKFSPTGALVYSTYLGGSGEDLGTGITVDSAGEAYITGYTSSPDFPTTPGALQPTFDNSIEAFVTKLNSAGDGLVYSTYLGGSARLSSNAIAVDPAGDAYVTGLVTSSGFPTQNPEQPSCGDPGCSQGDAFVSKLNPAGSALVYSTYLGGSGQDIAFAIAVDSSGNAFVAGYTTSTNFPTLHPAQPSCGDPDCSLGDAFVTKFDSAGSLVYSTYLGGSGKDQAYGIAVDSTDAAYVTGATASTTDFPLLNPLQPVYGGGTADAFVTKIAGPDVTPPTSTASIPLCHGPVTVTVTDNPGGSGAFAVLYRLDGGPVGTVATTGNPGSAAIPIPEGIHTLEYWGEDVTGNQESPHHVVSVLVDTIPPALSIVSDQGLISYEIGDHASVTITASAISGLAANPSQSHKRIPTNTAGRFTASTSATDRCGNSATALFTYTVIPNPTLASSVNLEAKKGQVTVKLPSTRPVNGNRSRRGFAALAGARQVPVGTIVHATAGEVQVTTATARGGHVQSGTFQGGNFTLLQPRADRGLVELRLIDAASRLTCKRTRAANPTRAFSARQLGVLYSNAKGRFRTSGLYAWATAGTPASTWSISDRCDGTLIRVTRGSVKVHDIPTGANTTIRARHQYLAYRLG